jgi:glutamyl-tRNA reductase
MQNRTIYTVNMDTTVKTGVQRTLMRLQKEEALKTIQGIKKNLDIINKKNLKTVKKRVKNIITYSKKEEEAVKLLVENKRIYQTTYYIRTHKGLPCMVTRVLFSTPFLKKICLEKGLKLESKT